MVIRKRKHGCAPGKNASATGHSVTASAASPTSPSATEADFGVLGRRSGHSNRDAGQLQKRQQNRALTNSALNPEVRSFRDKRAKRENFGLAGQPGSAEVCAEKSMTVALFVRPTVRQRMWAQLGWRRETYRNPTFSTFAQKNALLRGAGSACPSARRERLGGPAAFHGTKGGTPLPSGPSLRPLSLNRACGRCTLAVGGTLPGPLSRLYRLNSKTPRHGGSEGSSG